MCANDRQRHLEPVYMLTYKHQLVVDDVDQHWSARKWTTTSRLKLVFVINTTKPLKGPQGQEYGKILDKPEVQSHNFLEIMSCVLQNQAETHHVGHYGVLFH